MANPVTDPDLLRKAAYASDELLRLRHYIHENYSVPRVDFTRWALSRVRWRGDERVLDVGCGPGVYARTLHEMHPGIDYCGVDFSARMLESHPLRRCVAVGDAQTLPFPDASFDVVMANHMLYHVPDIPRAITECRRLLRPGGLLLATTNSVDTMPQLRDLYKRAILVLSAPGQRVELPPPTGYLFSLESGTRQLARQFYAVVRHDLPGSFVFDSIDPVMLYLESTRSLSEPMLPTGITWDSVMLIVREQIKNQLSYFGQIVIHKLSGALLATDDGDFIEPFIARQRAG